MRHEPLLWSMTWLTYKVVGRYRYFLPISMVQRKNPVLCKQYPEYVGHFNLKNDQYIQDTPWFYVIQIRRNQNNLGGFQLLDLIIPEIKSHVIPYKFKSSHWLKLQHSDGRANLVKDFFLQINFPPMRALEFIRDHMTFKLRYNQIQ